MYVRFSLVKFNLSRRRDKLHLANYKLSPIKIKILRNDFHTFITKVFYPGMTEITFKLFEIS